MAAPHETLKNCPDCGVAPGQPHCTEACDVQRCTVCGGQYLSCECPGHDPVFARWTGLWPGSAEAAALEVDLNQFYQKGWHTIFFTKPVEACAACKKPAEGRKIVCAECLALPVGKLKAKLFARRAEGS